MAKSYSPRPSTAGEFSTTAAAASGGRRDELLADGDVGDAEVAGPAGVGVADRAGRARRPPDDTGGAVGGLAALERPHAVGLGGPHVTGGLEQVVGEVVRGARVVGAVHRGDRGVGQRGVRVVRGDGRVVPGGDRAGEDARDGRRGQVQLVDALEVEDDRDRRDVVGQLEDARRRRSAPGAAASSSSSSAASEPAKSVAPAMNCSRPPPEPTGS